MAFTTSECRRRRRPSKARSSGRAYTHVSVQTEMHLHTGAQETVNIFAWKRRAAWSAKDHMFHGFNQRAAKKLRLNGPAEVQQQQHLSTRETTGP